MSAPSIPPEHASGSSKPESELKRRVLSALVLASLALSSDWYGGLAFAVIWGIAAVAVLREWNMVIGLSGRALWASFTIGSLGIVVAIFSVLTLDIAPLIGFLPPMVAGVLLVFFIKRSGVTPLWLFFGPFYAAAVVVGPLAIRDRGSEGLVIIVWLYFVVWISDIGAFFVGRRIGGPKLWPSVSPRKTWSGLFGGLFFGTLVPVATVYAAKTFFSINWIDGWLLVGITLSTALVAECGDLFESAMKRRFHVKDTGTLIPGHGGIMDRLDSYTAAAFYLVVITGVLGI